jgi:hypothetical protein
LTNQASIALENARLYQSTLSTAERFSILNQASYQVGANLDPEQIYMPQFTGPRTIDAGRIICDQSSG